MSGNEYSVERVMEQIESVHRELARMSLDLRLGIPSALNRRDVFETYSLPTRRDTVRLLREAAASADTTEEAYRIETIMFGCMDLTVEQEIASLVDMVNFYSEGGRMHVRGEKIPALEVVPWLQSEPDFDKREEMRKECDIWFKAVINPMLTGILELTVRAVKEKFGYENYVRFSEAKKQTSFNHWEALLTEYLNDTEEVYYRRMTPWVKQVIGRPFKDLSRYHALYLVRIKKFDAYFPVSNLGSIVTKTFAGLGFDLSARSDVLIDISDNPAKNPDGVCIGEEIPGKVHVLAKPLGGLIDVETLLHETGHAFFLSNIDSGLPVEFRRLYRSPALDETFAFLFTELIENCSWLTTVAGMTVEEAGELSDLFKTKRLCLIRRYIGKFLAEKEFHERGDLKNSELYCKRLGNATGFIYEPRGYLVDMEPDFYSLDYLNAWAGAYVLRSRLEDQFGDRWFLSPQAGDFLRGIAAGGRRRLLPDVMLSFCGTQLRLPDFKGD